jgi:hypothetical protein
MDQTLPLPTPEPSIPNLPPQALGEPVVSAKDEKKDLEGPSRQLDHSLKSWAGYGALAIALVSYLAGFALIGIFAGMHPRYPRVDAASWHVVVAMLVALFSVPTVLVLAVLRNSVTAQKAASADSLHEAIGQGLVGLIDRLTKMVAK